MSLAAIREADVAGFILAGGKSSRMGTDKALVLFRGQPLIVNALSQLREAGMPAAILGSKPNLAAYGEQIPDAFPEAGPLAGVHAALSSSYAREWNLFLPVDMPLMPPIVLRTLIERAQEMNAPVMACTLDGRLQPFPVVLHRDALPVIEAALSSGQTACYAAWKQVAQSLGTSLEAIAAETLFASEARSHGTIPDPALWFESANTPSTLARLEEIAEAINANLARISSNLGT